MPASERLANLLGVSTSERLTQVLKEAQQRPIEFDDSHKFILFSDCHRGDNGWADDFAHNQVLLFQALRYYFEKGFSYIEVGDGDELWENHDFSDIRKAHDHIFGEMRKFHEAGRLHLIWGNHDIERSDPEIVKRDLYYYQDERTKEMINLFPGIEVREAIVLRHLGLGRDILVVHGHQGDIVNDRVMDKDWTWKVSRFGVRHFWRHLQLVGVNDLTRASHNEQKKENVEINITNWINQNMQVVICGHTHRSWFPNEGSPSYFNMGSCVHPRCITGMEIEHGNITLVKWWIKPAEDGTLCIESEPIVPSRRLDSIFEWELDRPRESSVHPDRL